MPGLTLPTRDGLVEDYERDYTLRVPDAETGDNTLVGIDARQYADLVMPVLAEGQRLSKLPSLDGLTDAQVEQEAEDNGLPRRLPAAGASGFVTVTTAAGGAPIAAGQKITNTLTQKKYFCIVGATYTTGQPVSIAAVDAGPDTNVDAGVIMQWDSPPPGLSSSATVLAQGDGAGLTGGREQETTAGIKQRIKDARSNPTAGANDAAYRKAVLDAPGLSVQAAWVHSCILGPGSAGIVFTLRPASLGASRVPNGAQIATVAALLPGQFGQDDSFYACTIVEVPTIVVLRVRWTRGANGWADSVPWPIYDASHFTISASPAPTTTTFRVATSMVSPPNPRAGQTIALWDAGAKKYRQKRILSVSGSASPWDITVDTALNASDTTFTPAAGDLVMPWSDSLASVAPVVGTEFDNLGPGEQAASSFDVGGMRERRWPPAASPPYAYELTGRVLTPLFALPQVEEVQLVEPALPCSAAPGTAGVSSNMLTLQVPAVYPL